jgi:hypothetical protein
MGGMRTDEVLAAVETFVSRVHLLDPASPAAGTLTLQLGGRTSTMTITSSVASALAEALHAYHDPRDFGSCDYCPSGRLDENFLCLVCGRPNGLFGQMVAERAAGHREPPSLPPAD